MRLPSLSSTPLNYLFLRQPVMSSIPAQFLTIHTHDSPELQIQSRLRFWWLQSNSSSLKPTDPPTKPVTCDPLTRQTLISLSLTYSISWLSSFARPLNGPLFYNGPVSAQPLQLCVQLKLPQCVVDCLPANHRPPCPWPHGPMAQWRLPGLLSPKKWNLCLAIP